MNLLCKLSFHKYKFIKKLNRRDYFECIEKCERCGQNFIVTHKMFRNTQVKEKKES